MAFLVQSKITEPWFHSIFLWRNRICCILFRNVVSDIYRAVCLIAKNVASSNGYTRKQIHCDRCIMYLTTSEEKVDRIPQGIYKNVDFSRLSAPAGANKLVVFRIYSPFFAPALWGCALMVVLSIQRFS